MPRVLSMMRTTVTPTERKKYMERSKQKRDHYGRAKCRFWVFEEAGLPGAFLEFFEADSAEALAAAHASAPESVVDPGRVYREVEF
jgi:hypothetical protein